QQTMNEDHLKQTINGAFADAIPSKPVDIGDSWQSSVTQNIMGGMAIKMTAENKLAAVEDKGGHKIAKIEFNGVGKIEGAAAGAPKLKADEITQKGNRYFDIDRGAFTEMKEDQTLKGSMTLQTPNGETTIKIDKTTSAKMTLKPADAK
ncbi:MAG TPA: DUF6263 family protein, partial [Pirellulales bacterium]|nr:DUF6263 family protein [Pirellulales bacterium]